MASSLEDGKGRLLDLNLLFDNESVNCWFALMRLMNVFDNNSSDGGRL